MNMILDLLQKVCWQLDEHNIKYMVSETTVLNINTSLTQS